MDRTGLQIHDEIKKMKLVLVNGCFDMLHVAHLRHLEEARSMGSLLVVGLTMDEGVGKGAGRPIIPQAERMEMLRALRCVYGVSLCFNSLEALCYWKPDIFVKGHDYKLKGLLQEELDHCAAHNIQIAYTQPNPQTTSGIIERIKCTS